MINIERVSNLFYNLTSLKYISLFDIGTSELFLNETNKELNNIDNLIVCQNSDIITNPNAKLICCDFNIDIESCESSNYITYSIQFKIEERFFSTEIIVKPQIIIF